MTRHERKAASVKLVLERCFGIATVVEGPVVSVHVRQTSDAVMVERLLRRAGVLAWTVRREMSDDEAAWRGGDRSVKPRDGWSQDVVLAKEDVR